MDTILMEERKEAREEAIEVKEKDRAVEEMGIVAHPGKMVKDHINVQVVEIKGKAQNKGIKKNQKNQRNQ